MWPASLRSIRESFLDALRTVKDPDLHKDIVTLNFVKDLKIDGRQGVIHHRADHSRLSR